MVNTELFEHFDYTYTRLADTVFRIYAKCDLDIRTFKTFFEEFNICFLIDKSVYDDLFAFRRIRYMSKT